MHRLRFGSGIERIILSMKEQGLTPEPLPAPRILVAHAGSAAKTAAIEVVFRLRSHGIGALMAFGERSLKSQMREANRLNAGVVIIIAEHEVEAQTLTVKNLTDGSQEEIPAADLILHCKTLGLH